MNNNDTPMTDADNDTQFELAAWELLEEARRERDEWKKKFTDLNNDLCSELRDPNGTICEYAEKLQNDLIEQRDAAMLMLARANRERDAVLLRLASANREIDELRIFFVE